MTIYYQKQFEALAHWLALEPTSRDALDALEHRLRPPLR
jgi:hypothetical protein